MGQRGPKGKPSNVITLEGNPGKRKINRREPVFTEGATCPKWLPPEAKREWRRIYRELMRNGLMTRADRALLAAFCLAWARIRDAQEMIDGRAEISVKQENGKCKMMPVEGGTVIVTDKGNLIQHPAVGMMNQAIQMLSGLAAHFGFSPAARARIVAGHQEGEQIDAFEEYSKKEREKLSRIG